MIWNAPAAFVLAMFAVTTIGALLPIRIEDREDHIVLTIAVSVDMSIFGPPAYILVWGGVLLAMPLIAAWHLLPRPQAGGRRGAVRAIGWLAVTAVAVSVGGVLAYLVYSGIFGRSYPLPLVTTQDVLIGFATITAGWMGTVAVRVVSQRWVAGSLTEHPLDPFDSVLLPFLFPVIGGLSVITASVALYHEPDPWPSFIVLLWCFPLYAVTAFDLHRRRLAQELRRDAMATQRLAAIGEVSARIVHQSRHEVGLMGWSIHRLRGLVGSTSPEDVAAASAELDGLSQAKDRLGAMLTAELLHEPRGRAARRSGRDGPDAADAVGVAHRDDRDEDHAGDEAAASTRSDGSNSSNGSNGAGDGAPANAAAGSDPPSGSLRSDDRADDRADVGDGDALVAVVERVCGRLGDRARDRGVDVSVRVPTDDMGPSVPDELGDVVFNLVDNAIDAAERQVIVTLLVDPSRATLRVADDGTGLPDADRRRAFEPFHTTKAHGTGMGLAIADAIVGDLGGELRYERESGWTVFVVILPAASVFP